MTTEQLAVAVWDTVKRATLDIRFHSVGRLIDRMREMGYAEVAEWIEEQLAKDERLTRSVFIRALFEYWRENSVVRRLDEAREELREESAKRREARGGPKRAARPKVRKRSVRRLRDD